MKTINLIILIPMMLSMTLSAISIGELRRQINKSYGALKTLQAEVTQTNYFRQLDRKITYQGKIYYSAERLLIDFDRPHRQRLAIDNYRVHLFDAQTNTVFKTKVLPDFNKLNPVDILRHYLSVSTVSITGHDRNSVSVLLIPNKDPLIKQINARIRRSDWIMEQLSYQDNGGNTVTYDFANIRINTTIPAAVWEFKLPPDTQVIEQ